MNEEQIKLRRLMERLTSNDASREEFDEFFTLIRMEKHEDSVKAALMESIKNEPVETRQPENLEAIVRHILAARAENVSPVRRLFPWRRVAVAAVVVLMAGTGAYFLLFNKPRHEMTRPAEGISLVKNDVLPGRNKAVLILANGSSILLDSVANGILAQQGNATVVKQNNGQLAYNTQNEKPTEVLYNTLATPRGGQYRLVLPDGSNVWLNAASSIRYPTAFAGKERKIGITGEAYFEVAKNAGMPFIVTVNGMDVKVLGTRFNVNAYDDEATIRTTLLEGAVQVTKDAATAILKPGQQSRLTKLGTLNLIHDADIEEAVAWKNGMFSFKSADIKTVMRQIARWYDVEIVYEKEVQELFHTEINRNTNASDVFNILETTGGVHFKIEGKKVMVMP